MKKKLISMLLAVSMVIGAAFTGGCSTTNQGDKNAASTKSDDSEGVKETAVKSGDEVHLKMFIGIPRFKDQFEGYFDKFCEKYEKENGVKVTYELEMPGQNAATVLKTRLASKDSVDIMAVHAITELPAYVQAGYIEPMDGQPFVDKMVDSAKDAVTIDGHPQGVLLESLMWGYLYNKDMFAEIGIKTADQMPMTMAEMEEVCKKLEDKGNKPFVQAYKEIAFLFWPSFLGIQGITRTDNKDWYERMNKGEGSFSEVTDFFNVLDMIEKYGTDKALDKSSGDACADFALGKGAMLVTGPWYADSIMEVNKDINMGVAALPVNDNPDATMINVSASTTLCVNSGSQNKEVATALLNYMLDDQESGEFYESCMFNPVTDAQQKSMNVFPWVQDALDWVDMGHFYPDDQNWPNSCSEDIQKVLQAYYSGAETKESFVEKADKLWKDSLSAN